MSLADALSHQRSRRNIAPAVYNPRRLLEPRRQQRSNNRQSTLASTGIFRLNQIEDRAMEPEQNNQDNRSNSMAIIPDSSNTTQLAGQLASQHINASTIQSSILGPIQSTSSAVSHSCSSADPTTNDTVEKQLSSIPDTEIITTTSATQVAETTGDTSKNAVQQCSPGKSSINQGELDVQNPL